MAAKKLTALQIQTAMLSGMGRTPREIARLLDCHEKTVSNLLQNPAWVAERQKWIEAGLAKLDAAVTAQRAGMLALHDEFITGVRNSIHAELPNGEPNWPVRLAGLKMIHDHPAIKALLGSGETGEDKGVGQVTVVQFHIPADKMPRQVGDAEVIIDQTPRELEAGDG